jgi:hypothetical protein
MDVAKVDQGDVTYVAIFQRHVASVCFECFRCFTGMFHLCFSNACCKCVYLDVAYVSHISCMCFIWMLQWFSSIFFMCLRSISSVSTAFRRMLQLLYLNVLRVDRVLHLSSPPSTASSRCVLLVPAWHPYDAAAGSFRIGGAAPLPLLSLGQHGRLAWSARNRVQRAGVHLGTSATV